MDETVWLSQQQMAELFQTSRTNVVEHIKHIYEECELDEESTCRKFRQVRKEGKREVLRAAGEKLLEGAGSVSHAQAIAQANVEYQKYQRQNISPVEEDYLLTIKDIERQAKKHQ